MVLLECGQPFMSSHASCIASRSQGLIFGPTGAAMTPSHTRRNGKLYRYYVSTDVLKRDGETCLIQRMPCGEIETAVIDQLRGLLCAPEIVMGTWRAARQSGEDISEAEVREALGRLDPLWDELFPAEHAIHGLIVLARIAGIRNQPLKRPVFNGQHFDCVSNLWRRVAG